MTAEEALSIATFEQCHLLHVADVITDAEVDWSIGQIAHLIDDLRWPEDHFEVKSSNLIGFPTVEAQYEQYTANPAAHH
jgi:hypothetical protein